MTQKYKVYINNKSKIITENWHDFCSQYNYIEAAGGLVFNSKNQILFIFRNNKWDLPKGKKEQFESLEECALREVEEECGVNGLLIDNKILDTYHTYVQNGVNVLKKTTWYKMHTNLSQSLTPQLSEGIERAIWVNKMDVKSKLQNSYLNIKDVLAYENS